MKLTPEITFRKFDQEQQIVYGEVYIPNVLDSHGHFMKEDTVREMAHDAFSSGNISKIDVMHQNVLIGARPIESFIARKNDPDFLPGSWVLGLHFSAAADVWDQIKKNELSGYSIEIEAKLQDVEVEIDIPDRLEGVTASQEDHTHKYFVELDDLGRVIKGFTDEVNGHSHNITASSRTEEADQHRHSYNFLDVLLAA